MIPVSGKMKSNPCTMEVRAIWVGTTDALSLVAEAFAVADVQKPPKINVHV
jgi:hypothetical protein